MNRAGGGCSCWKWRQLRGVDARTNKKPQPGDGRGRFLGPLKTLKCRKQASDLLGYLAGFKAACADPDTTGLAVDPGVYRFEIDVKASQAQVVGLADIMADARFLSAYFANLCHLLLRTIESGLLSQGDSEPDLRVLVLQNRLVIYG